MHVMMLPSWYPTGPEDLAGSFFREQARVLAGAGHRVAVLAPRLVSLQDVVRLHPGARVRWTREDGIAVGRLDLVQWVPRARTLRAALAGGRGGSVHRAFATYVARFGRPDVLHAHSLYPGGYLARELSRHWGIPWVLTEHRSLDHLRVLTPLGARREARVVAGARVRCGVSHGHAAHLARRFGDGGGKWEVLHDLVDDPAQAPCGPRAGSAPLIGHLSNLAPVKRLDLVVGAFAALLRAAPDARLLVAGPLDGRDDVRGLVASSGCASSVELLGALPREQVPAFLAGLDALLMPSDSETFGVAIAESLAQGTPVVATRTWGSSDIVGEGDGMLVEGGRGAEEVRAGLAHALVDVVHEGGGRDGRRERCLARFGREAFLERSLEVYAEALR